MTTREFIMDSKSLKLKKLLNQDFLEIEILAISEGDTRNNCAFSLKSMEKAIPSFYNKFILGYFNVRGDVHNEGNFEEHNADLIYDAECEEYYLSYLAPNAEKALGIIRESDKVEITEIDGKKWIKLTAAILVKYNREAVKHLLKSKNKKKISVEVTVLKSHKENGQEIIDEFVLDGITILGTRRNSNKIANEGIVGASMTLNFIQSDYYDTQRKALTFAYQKLAEEKTIDSNENTEEIQMSDKGGITMLTENQKRDLLERYLIENYPRNEEDWIYIVDTMDDWVIVNHRGTYYKMPYEIYEMDDQITVKIDFESKIEVISSWKELKEFAETEDSETETCAECGNDPCTCAQAEDSQEKKVEEVADDTVTCVEEKPLPVDNMSTDEGETNQEKCAQSSEAEVVDKECECNQTLAATEDDQEDPDDDADKESDEESFCGTNSFALEQDKEIDGVAINTVFCADADSLQKLQTIVDFCQNLEDECQNLKNQMAQEHYASIAEDCIKTENRLTQEDCQEIMAAFAQQNSQNAFANDEVARNYVETAIACAIYKQIKSQNMTTKEFSCRLKDNATVKIEENVDSYEQMRKTLKY